MIHSWKSRDQISWLNGLGLDEVDLNDLRGVQNAYALQLDQYPIFGYPWRIWLLWDHDRLWGRFELGNTEGVFLVDPGVNPSLYDEGGSQELSFTWRGVQALKPNIFYCNELITKGKIRIHPKLRKIDGFFGYMDGDGSPGAKIRDKCAFNAKALYEPPLVSYTLEEVVELWNYYSPVSLRKERIRQILPSLKVTSDLGKKEWAAVVTIDSQVADDGGNTNTAEGQGNDEDLLVTIVNEGESDKGSIISTDEKGDDEASLVSHEFADT